jgi:hypothetical protein
LADPELGIGGAGLLADLGEELPTSNTGRNVAPIGVASFVWQTTVRVKSHQTKLMYCPTW